MNALNLSGKFSAAIYESGYRKYGVMKTPSPEELRWALWEEIRRKPRVFKVVIAYDGVDEGDIPKLKQAATDLAIGKRPDLDRIVNLAD